MSAETSTSSASFTRANKTRHVSLAVAVTLLAGLSAGAGLAQTASELRDPFSNKPFVHFYAVKRIGGAVANSEAIKLMKFAAS